MKISLDWISDFVDLADIDPEVIADRLTLATAEVEGCEVVERSIEGIVIAEVVEVKPLDASTPDKPLTWVTVDAGDRRYATVCGAPNVRAGMKSAFAPAGTTLADGTVIAATEIANQSSEGVLCSPKELGFSGFHDGILDCPVVIPAGTRLAEFVPARDVLIDVDNKSLTHRPDLWGHYGFARELAAVFERPLVPLPAVDLSKFDDLPPYSVTVEDADACPCYACIEFDVEATAPSPLRMQARLHGLGQRTYNLMVDVTNYVMLELGQPTHAFDARMLNCIRVAPCGDVKTFSTLDDHERQMEPDDLMIWNQERPVALAGIMGGQNSQVEQSTTRVLLESANFKGSHVRTTSTRLGLRTESSQRFEKSQPPVNVKTSIGRILNLVDGAGVDWKATSRCSIAGDLKAEFRPLTVSIEGVHAAAGVNIPDAQVVSILRRLGFEVEATPGGELKLGIPPFRSERDISIPADVVEEILRVYGYDNVPPALPSARLAPVEIHSSLRQQHKVQRLLAGSHRFVEVHNYIWMDDSWLEKIGYQPSETLVLKNPSIEGRRQLRTSLLPNLLTLVELNRVHRDQFRLFEVGRVFHPVGEKDRRETTNLAGVSYLQADAHDVESHYQAIKGAIEDVAQVIGCGELTFRQSEQATAPWQNAGEWVSICLGDQQVGSLGMLSQSMLELVAPEGQVVWFELELDLIEGVVYPAVTYEPPSVFPGSWQDFSLVWSLSDGYSKLKDTLDEFEHPLIRRLEFHSFYRGKGVPSGMGSYTFRCLLGADDRTLSGEDLEAFHAGLLAFLEAKGIPLR